MIALRLNHTAKSVTPERRSTVRNDCPVVEERGNIHYFISMKQTKAVTLLGALAQESRLTIFRELVKAHDLNTPAQAGLAVGALKDKLNISAPTLSFHLKEMTNAGLITPRREGRSIIYTADLDAMQALIGYLLEDCCGGACG